MTISKTFLTGITGALLFVLTTVIAGIQYPGYDYSSQFISELYAVGAPDADFIRHFLYIPSGFLLFLFSVFSLKETDKSALSTLGFLGVGVGYGLGTVICGFFNCDAGCNPDFVNPSVSQLIHNLTGFFTYLMVPPSIALVAIASRKWKNAASFSNSGFILAALSFCFFILLNADLQSPYKGVIQRIIEGSILLWIILCSLHVLKNKRNAPTQ
ncbi:DUF998 domain-containing protein [Flavobacterium amniphilum]|uniref:DUF998 domain-containing protein n=1 Tax=Flavobacterium amniphilum TaxID=1834035 RepID=UPI002029B496|nr:DUF998 domain-containing protein [Flavobacterium amniphilum]MCL9805898.1 DUF998 domain-containing protein [Flavobacterium amniphilum]